MRLVSRLDVEGDVTCRYISQGFWYFPFLDISQGFWIFPFLELRGLGISADWSHRVVNGRVAKRKSKAHSFKSRFGNELMNPILLKVNRKIVLCCLD